jgi:hypothetical protein
MATNVKVLPSVPRTVTDAKVVSFKSQKNKAIDDHLIKKQ